MTPNERLEQLRARASKAEAQFMRVTETIGVRYDEAPEHLVHDNIRVVEADSVPFRFELDPDKQQVVVVLRGAWTMRYGGTAQPLDVSDVRKVPGESLSTIMETEEAGAKFVYVQFK